MKKLALLLFATVAGLYASESSWDVTQVTFNKSEFISQSGFVERGILGYLCCDVMTPSRYMRKRLKEKDLLYEGKPLAQHSQADDILSAFAEKYNLSICPFKSKKKLDVNNSFRSSSSFEVLCCTSAGCGIAALSTVLGVCVACLTQDIDSGCGACIATLAVLGWPYLTAADDALTLNEGLKVKPE